MLGLFTLLQIEMPTQANLPYWFILLLVSGILGMFWILIRNFNARIDRLEKEKDELIKERKATDETRIKEGKEVAVLLDRTIEIIQSHFKDVTN